MYPYTDTIIVFGSEGLVGSRLLELLSLLKVHSIGVSHNECNISDLNEVENILLNTYKYVAPTIVNCAMYNGPDEKRSFGVNYEGVKNLSLVCELTGARLIQLSTDYVFISNSIPKDGLYFEDIDIEHHSRNYSNDYTPYIESKMSAERYLAKHASNYQIIRTSWVYGASCNGIAKGFVQDVISTLLRGELFTVNKEWTSIPTDVHNLVSYIVAIIGWYKNGLFEKLNLQDHPFNTIPSLKHIIHYTDDIRPYSRYQWALLIAQYMDKYISNRYGDNELLKLYDSYTSQISLPSDLSKYEHKYTPLGMRYRMYDLPNLRERPVSVEEWESRALNDILDVEIQKLLTRN